MTIEPYEEAITGDILTPEQFREEKALKIARDIAAEDMVWLRAILNVTPFKRWR